MMHLLPLVDANPLHFPSSTHITSAIAEDESAVEKRIDQEQEMEEDASSQTTAVAINDLQSHCRIDTEITVDNDNDGSDQEDPPSAFAVHPVDIRFADAPDNDGVMLMDFSPICFFHVCANRKWVNMQTHVN
jgi:hypothetical protein